MKIVVEPTGALAAGALLEKKLDAQGGASAWCFGRQRRPGCAARNSP